MKSVKRNGNLFLFENARAKKRRVVPNGRAFERRGGVEQRKKRGTLRLFEASAARQDDSFAWNAASLAAILSTSLRLKSS